MWVINVFSLSFVSATLWSPHSFCISPHGRHWYTGGYILRVFFPKVAVHVVSKSQTQLNNWHFHFSQMLGFIRVVILTITSDEFLNHSQSCCKEARHLAKHKRRRCIYICVCVVCGYIYIWYTWYAYIMPTTRYHHNLSFPTEDSFWFWLGQNIPN